MILFVNSPGSSVKQKDFCFRLTNKDKTLDVSPEKVESVVITNKAVVSTQALVLALEKNIDFIFLDKYGDPIGRVWFSKLGSTALIRRRQLEAETNGTGVELVTDLVKSKMDNQIKFLKKLMYSRPGQEEKFEKVISEINEIQRKIDTLDGNISELRNSLMGFEGSAGRAYFQCISGLLPEKYRFNGRSRRPAKDPFNAVLNYCLGVLYSRVEKACIISGLDPYIGFLHTDNYNKKSLVFDLIEPFRVYAEQTAVYLFTGRKIKDDFFYISDKAVSLNQKGKPFVLDSFSNHMEETVRYKNKNVKRKYIMQHEAHKMANILLADDGEKRPDWLEIKEF